MNSLLGKEECFNRGVNMGNTVFVLGLDGLSRNYYNKLRKNGVIPFLANIIEQSVRFSLYAFPPVTYPSWINIMTGVNPGVHGIFGFLYMDGKCLLVLECHAKKFSLSKKLMLIKKVKKMRRW